MKPETLERRASDRVRRRERVAALSTEIDEVGADEFCRLRYEDWPDVPTRLLRRLNRTPVMPEYLHEKVARVNRNGTLTEGRLDVLILVAQGYRNFEVAEILGASPSASRDKMKRVIAVFRARNASHAVHVGHQRGLLDGVPPGKTRTVANHNKTRGWSASRLASLRLAAEGYGQKEIATQTGRSVFSVKDNLRSAQHLLGAVNAPNAIHRGHLAGVLTTKEATCQ